MQADETQPTAPHRTRHGSGRELNGRHLHDYVIVVGGSACMWSMHRSSR